jgi:hypothetical protein
LNDNLKLSQDLKGGARYNEISKRSSTVRKYDNGEIIIDIVKVNRRTSRGGSISKELGNDLSSFTSGKSLRSGGRNYYEISGKTTSRAGDFGELSVTKNTKVRFKDDVRGVIKDINLQGTSKSTGSSFSGQGPTITETKSISPNILAPRQSKVLNNPKSSLQNGILGVVGVSTGRSSGDALRTGTSNCIGGVVSGFKKGFSKRQGSALTGNSILEEPRASNKNINTNLNSPRTTGTILSGLSTGLSTALSGGLASGLGSPSRSRGSQVTRTNQKTAVVPIVTPISPPISSTRNRITPRGFNTGRGFWNIPRPSPVKVFGGRLPFTLSDRGYGKGGIGVRAGKTRYKSDIASSFLGIKSPKIPVSYRKGLGGLTFRPLISSRKSKKREKKRKKR